MLPVSLLAAPPRFWLLGCKALRVKQPDRYVLVTNMDLRPKWNDEIRQALTE